MLLAPPGVPPAALPPAAAPQPAPPPLPSAISGDRAEGRAEDVRSKGGMGELMEAGAPPLDRMGEQKVDKGVRRWLASSLRHAMAAGAR